MHLTVKNFEFIAMPLYVLTQNNPLYYKLVYRIFEGVLIFNFLKSITPTKIKLFKIKSCSYIAFVGTSTYIKPAKFNFSGGSMKNFALGITCY